MIDLEMLKNRVTELQNKLNEINSNFEAHKENIIGNETEYFNIYNDLFNKKFKLEKQIDKAKELLTTLEFIFED